MTPTVTTVHLALSQEAIASQIYAEGALRHHLGNNRPPLLTPDSAAALREVIRDAFIRTCLRLDKWITEYSVLDSGPDAAAPLLTIQLTVPHGTGASMLRNALEQAVSRLALYTCYISADPPYATSCHGDYSDIIKAIIARLRRSPLSRISPGA